MSRKLFGVFLSCIILIGLTTWTPVHAVGTVINRFTANCNNFSVDVTVSGSNNDGNNADKFRYLIADANGKKLYQEDSARVVGTSQNSNVANLSFDADGAADGAPGKNPVTFSVIELDGNNNVISTVQKASYDVACVAASGQATQAGTFRPPDVFKAAVIVDSPIYDQPNGNRVQGLSSRAGQSWIVVYRTADNQWLSIFVGGPEIVWVPARTLAIDVNRLPVRPSRIDTSATVSPTPGATSTSVSVPLPGVISVRTTANVNVRNAPSSTGTILGRATQGIYLAALARSASSSWILVQFNGATGWISAYYVRFYGGRLRDLPIVRQP